MKINPWNRRLLVGIDQEKELDNELAILIPEDYKPTSNEHLVGTVLSVATDATQDLLGKRVVVQPNGIEEIQIEGATHYLILENYIVAVLDS